MTTLTCELSREDLKEIHEAHNVAMDCDCEECREYRRLTIEEPEHA